MILEHEVISLFNSGFFYNHDAYEFGKSFLFYLDKKRKREVEAE